MESLLRNEGISTFYATGELSDCLKSVFNSGGSIEEVGETKALYYNFLALHTYA